MNLKALQKNLLDKTLAANYYLLVNTRFDRFTKKVAKFNLERGWNPLPEDTAKSIILEAAELLEHFQWDATRTERGTPKEKNVKEISYEVADVFIYLIHLCNGLNINLLKAAEEKLKKSEEKYPKQMFKGKHNEKFYSEQKKKYRDRKK